MRRHFARPESQEQEDLQIRKKLRRKPLQFVDPLAALQAQPVEAKQAAPAAPAAPSAPAPAPSAPAAAALAAPSAFLSELRKHKKPQNPYTAAPIPAKNLVFHEPGKISRLAERDRLEASGRSLAVAEPPTSEWWDNASPDIGHTYSLDLPAPPSPPPLKTYLTPEEQRRKRRNERQAAQTEQRERIKSGQEAAPPPKLSRSNVLAVMGGEYLRDPTKFDLQARQAEEARRAKHEQANEERKKSGDERWEAAQAKLEASRAKGLVAAAYQWREPVDPKTRYIIDYTAKKFAFTGALVSACQDTLLVVEGGEREQVKFERLLRKLGTGERVFSGWTDQRFAKWSMHAWGVAGSEGEGPMAKGAEHEHEPEPEPEQAPAVPPEQATPMEQPGPIQKTKRAPLSPHKQAAGFFASRGCSYWHALV